MKLGGIILKIFTYGQYIKCIHTYRLHAVMQLAEESVEYELRWSPENRFTRQTN